MILRYEQNLKCYNVSESSSQRTYHKIFAIYKCKISHVFMKSNLKINMIEKNDTT